MLTFIEFFSQNKFINYCARKKIVKIPEYRNHGVPDFFVRYRRTYVLNNYSPKCVIFLLSYFKT